MAVNHDDKLFMILVEYLPTSAMKANLEKQEHKSHVCFHWQHLKASHHPHNHSINHQSLNQSSISVYTQTLHNVKIGMIRWSQSLMRKNNAKVFVTSWVSLQALKRRVHILPSSGRSSADRLSDRDRACIDVQFMSLLTRQQIDRKQMEFG